MMTIGWVLMSPLISLFASLGIAKAAKFTEQNKAEYLVLFMLVELFIVGVGIMAINWSW